MGSCDGTQAPLSHKTPISIMGKNRDIAGISRVLHCFPTFCPKSKEERQGIITWTPRVRNYSSFNFTWFKIRYEIRLQYIKNSPAK